MLISNPILWWSMWRKWGTSSYTPGTPYWIALLIPWMWNLRCKKRPGWLMRFWTSGSGGCMSASSWHFLERKLGQGGMTCAMEYDIQLGGEQDRLLQSWKGNCKIYLHGGAPHCKFLNVGELQVQEVLHGDEFLTGGADGGTRSVRTVSGRAAAAKYWRRLYSGLQISSRSPETRHSYFEQTWNGNSGNFISHQVLGSRCCSFVQMCTRW